MKIIWQGIKQYKFRNLTSSVQLAADIISTLEGLQIPLAIGVNFIDDIQMQDLNLKFRQTNTTTDVLSFPSANFPKGTTAGENTGYLKRTFDDSLRAYYLGDLFLSENYIIKQAQDLNQSVTAETVYLCIHGILHLMGYDHLENEEKRKMREMEKRTLEIINSENLSENTITDEQLLNLAKQAMERSYSPYSKYPVGACILSKDGRVFQGANIENASYGLSNCGERTAVFKAISEGAREFITIAIASKHSAPWPCGACRQVLNEFAPNIRVLLTWGDAKIKETSLTELLPHGFGYKDLQKDSE